MRNKYPGKCYRCGQWVPTGKGHFERFFGSWRVQHADCAIENRGETDPERERRQIEVWKHKAKGTGKTAQRARYKLRLRGL